MIKKFAVSLTLILALAASNQAFAASPNTVRGFVYEWFGLFDDNTPTQAFLARLAPEGLEVAFPEETLTSHADFTRWYDGILATFEHATHDVKRLDVSRQAEGWLVDLTVEWNATTFGGEAVQGLFHQVWSVTETTDGRLLIQANRITPVTL